MLDESHGPDKALDLPGLALASGGLLGLVWGLVHGNSDGWSSPQIVASLAIGAVLLAAFVAWEARAKEPMLPLRFFESRAFSAANGASLAMYFGMFGSIFLLSQFFQTAQGYSPFESGLRVLPWTAMPMIVAPIAGGALRSDRRQALPRRRARAAGDRAGLDRGRLVGRRRLLVARRAVHPLGDRHGHVLRSRRQRRPQRRRRSGTRARRPARRTRSARSAASSASRCSRRSSPAPAATSRRRSSTRASSRRSGSARSSSASAR